MKRLITLGVFLLCSLLTFAQFSGTVTDEQGVKYTANNDEGTCYVSGRESNLSATIVIPEMYEGRTVTSIGQSAFDGCSGLTSISIPNSVTRIKGWAFKRCSGLISVTIGNSVTSIGLCAFQDCSSLTSVTIPNSVTSIGWNAFDCCSGLISVIIPNSVTSIGSFAFQYCSSLTSITIPNSVTSIGAYTFNGCRGLTSITIPNSVTSIENSAFEGCSGLTSITIPSRLTSIGSHAFLRCSGLTSFTIPNSVTSIGQSAFGYCGLTSITIPNNVTSIGESTFQGCSGLTSVSIPNSVTSIGNYAFKYCSALTSVNIPSSVTSIGWNVFDGCSGLTSVTIPNSVTSIEPYAFEECSSLTCVKVQLETPVAISQDVFTNRTNATLYVPYGSKDFYEHAAYWQEFKEIKEVEGMIDVSILDDALYAEDVTVYPDGATCLPILMKNKESITNIQFDVVLPEGVTIKNSTLTNRKGSDHAITTSSVNGATRFMVTSMGGKVFCDNDGAVINLSLAIDKNLAAGHQEITLRNVTLSTSGAVKVNTPTCMAVLTVSDIESGDADGDGVTDVNDVTSTINHILKKPVANFVRGAADVDGDNVIDVNDVQATIDKALGKTSSSRGKNRQDEEPALDPQ